MTHLDPLSRPAQLPAKAQNFLAKEMWLRNATEMANTITAWLALPQMILDLLQVVGGRNGG